MRTWYYKDKEDIQEERTSSQKYLAIQKKHNVENMSQQETFHSNNMTILKENIKSMFLEGDSASFKLHSGAIFNCITIEETFKIKSLLKKRKIKEILEKHLDDIYKSYFWVYHMLLHQYLYHKGMLSVICREILLGRLKPQVMQKLIMKNRM